MIHAPSRLAEVWAQGVVQQLLSMVHKMWIARNKVVHTWDEDGHLVKERLEMEMAIVAQFELEYEDLRPQDRHLIELSQQVVLQKMVTEQ